MKKNLFNISINLDEISDDLHESLEFLLQNGVNYTEIRTVNGRNFVEQSEEEIKHVSDIIRRYGFQISAVASPLFKWYTGNEVSANNIDLFGMDPHLTKKEKLELIEKTIVRAHILDTQRIRIFSGLLSKAKSAISHEDKELIKYLLQRTREENLIAALENEPVCKISSYNDFSNLLSNPDFEGLKAWLDIGNLYEIGEQVTQEQIRQLAPFIEYLHIKDPVNIHEHKFVPVGNGIINYKRLFSDLSHYLRKPTFLSIETHVKQNKQEATKISLEYLREIIRTPRVRYALVGTGRISAKHNAAYKKSRNSELVGVYDIDNDKSLEISRVYDAEYYPSLESMLSDQRIDVVSICTPHNTHIPLAEKVINAKKIALVEKPFSIHEKQLKQYAKKISKNNKTYVVFQNLFNPPVQKMLRLKSRGELGNLKSFTITIRWWRDDSYYKDWHGEESISGGLLFTQAIHSIELLSHLTDLIIDSAYGYAWKSRESVPINDMAQAVVMLKNGVRGTIDICLDTQKQNVESSLFTVWEKGCVNVGGLALSEDSYTYTDSSGPMPQVTYDESLDYYGRGHAQLITALSNHILGNGKEKTALIHPGSLEKTVKFTRKLYNVISRG